MVTFEVCKQSAAARAGVIQTARGAVETPAFMPVGALGAVKSVTPEELVQVGARIIVGSTYHLYLRPGPEVVSRFGGLHRFMNWPGPILTDGGASQIFSVAKLPTATAEGIRFQSHIDGSGHFLTPEKAIDTQGRLGADIMMCLDRPLLQPASRQEAEQAADVTIRWAARCREAWRSAAEGRPALFGIVPGGTFRDLRADCAERLQALDFSGYALGGLNVLEPRALALETAGATLARLPAGKPRYATGVGTPEDLVELVALGADMFDSALPTQYARSGKLFCRSGTLSIAETWYREDTLPPDPQCGCPTCRHYSRAYLRHLFLARELLAYRLNSIHNIYCFLDLFRRMREAILADALEGFKKAFYEEREI
jgi:queuine tRNA-ribosyltransferase